MALVRYWWQHSCDVESVMLVWRWWRWHWCGIGGGGVGDVRGGSNSVGAALVRRWWWQHWCSIGSGIGVALVGNGDVGE